MNFSDYQANAMEFAVYKDKEYPFYALVEEVGEVFGKIAKAKRKGVEVDKPALKKELGDCLWQLAACAKECGVRELTYSPWRERSEFTILTVMVAETCDIFELGRSTPTKYLNACMSSFDALAYKYGWTIDEVMVENLYKLRDRQQRNTLVGEGDER